ncbi:hypothetical protein HPB52_002110 [Rhipicephalus sanguineus]|uniref:Uncharacterized protein n=1 Tax=Rhipicephalus sanguineus TaxID=34632 RepID=A0A9D4STQ5_RHISA|nr:hypothetical protein HPB52_002110 [Rhipicephalus sanguineus]
MAEEKPRRQARRRQMVVVGGGPVGERRCNPTHAPSSAEVTNTQHWRRGGESLPRRFTRVGKHTESLISPLDDAQARAQSGSYAGE